MKPFHIEPGMLTMRGVFYPTGYMILMFPGEQDARNAMQKLVDDGIDEGEVSLVSPQMFQEEVARTVGNADIPLPSAGTEADTVRKFTELASQGHFALMIHAPSAKESDRVMALLEGTNMSYGQKYRHLVIEDLET
ncbi:RNA-binding protein [Caenimonas sedimenti]|uniref:RNA-binding protein n=1 Tax=Caenimonas sedimenti TaxID=2596921 RepID=A0A562ZGL7_9BURK|nr:RNA-binding protein [Caenimonas sedimenti]TWO67710.1 RNA-binding protein [Caenimonas sedimenti]